MNPLWSWVLTIVGVTGFILAGRKVWWCWYINIACQGLWITYAIVTEQWGFIVASLIYTVVFTQNAIKWTKEHKQKQEMMAYANKDAVKTEELYENAEATYNRLITERQRLIDAGVDPDELAWPIPPPKSKEQIAADNKLALEREMYDPNLKVTKIEETEQGVVVEAEPDKNEGWGTMHMKDFPEAPFVTGDPKKFKNPPLPPEDHECDSTCIESDGITYHNSMRL